MLVLISLGNIGVCIVRLFTIGLTNLKHICEMCTALKSSSTLVGLILNWPRLKMFVLIRGCSVKLVLVRRVCYTSS